MRLGAGRGTWLLLLASAATAGMPQMPVRPAGDGTLPVRLVLVEGADRARLVGDARGVMLSQPGEARVRLHVVLPDASPGDPPWVVRLERDSLALRLESGGYRIELRLNGYETETFDVYVTPSRKITYRADLRRLP